MTAMRIEHDAFGPVEIPAGKYWGAQTQRAASVFEVGTERFPACLLHAFGLQKIAAARANERCGALDAALAAQIVVAAEELSRGLFDAHFPLTVWQTGSGTQTNMNANEVIANRANELLGQPLGTKSPVHPNDHVNASQSSNDSFPTVMHIAAAMELTGRLLPSLAVLKSALEERALAFAGAVKVARTHLMDAVPMTMGQAFDAFAWQVGNGMARLQDALPRLLVVAQGGTAAGTGLNAPKNFDVLFCEELVGLTNLQFKPHPCKFEGMSGHDALVELSGALNVVATSLMKIANDIRWMGSGPRCGIGELVVPDDGLTSSIMPGKRNPTIAEVLAQAAMQVIGNHVTVTMAGASGNFELNVAKPVLIHNVLQSIRVMADSARVFAGKLVAGLEVDRERLASNLGNALLAVTALNPVLGYEAATRIARDAMRTGRPVADLVLEAGLLDAETLEQLLKPEGLTRPYRFKKVAV